MTEAQQISKANQCVSCGGELTTAEYGLVCAACGIVQEHRNDPRFLPADKEKEKVFTDGVGAERAYAYLCKSVPGSATNWHRLYLLQRQQQTDYSFNKVKRVWQALEISNLKQASIKMAARELVNRRGINRVEIWLTFTKIVCPEISIARIISLAKAARCQFSIHQYRKICYQYKIRPARVPADEALRQAFNLIIEQIHDRADANALGTIGTQICQQLREVPPGIDPQKMAAAVLYAAGKRVKVGPVSQAFAARLGGSCCITIRSLFKRYLKPLFLR